MKPEGSSSNNGQPGPSSRLIPILTKLAHGSAPFLSTFLVIHLSAPVLANFGGSNLSSKLMLLGREYYQTALGERYLLLTPLAIHVASSVAKRLVSPPKQPRKLTSLLSITGYAALLVFIPIHFSTHRLAPTDASAPIFAVGPSELDYEFVKTGLAQFPWRSWALYTGLVASVLVHMVEGDNVILPMWLGAPRIPSRTRKVIACMVALPVLLGVWTLSKEPLMALTSLAERYSASFARCWVYRL
ncbi:hypothetical protein HYDPIDRAFT_134453 [Hydnomerulius pinastri MD-312]|uniref:Mitochondrial adapter protein MCP1 transmembrane domain-containing protein n=1 Tax=Hydnomerulius pinastri MD-312 TaxID=994086 RepID=A0A0C9VYD0_9AGAM|nr:hypothetical protein HYDPIDRAFT_134453 [Hydnomerulius pinastri MD-312]